MERIPTAGKLPRSHPEELGISPEKVAAFLHAAEEDQIELHSFMLVRHGSVAAEGWWSPYTPETSQMLFSLSKSFTSTAIGFAVSERLLSLDDKVISFFPGDRPGEMSANLEAMNVRHLLTMSSGHLDETMLHMQKDTGGNWVKAFLELPVPKAPGTHFQYNTGATYMLSAILHACTGQSLQEYLQPRLFEPLGIQPGAWEACPRGIQVGGYGFCLTTEDIAKFGLLYLQRGSWNGSQLLPEEWVAEATSRQIATGDDPDNRSDWGQGYGYQFWQCKHHAYRGDGAFGQFCIVIPERDAVVVLTSGTGKLGEALQHVWDYLLPALNPEPLVSRQSPEGAALSTQLSRLNLMPQHGPLSSPAEAYLNGQVFQMAENILQIITMSFTFTPAAVTVALEGKDGLMNITLGRGEWSAVHDISLGSNMYHSLSCFSWPDEATLRLTVRVIDTPFCLTADIGILESSIVYRETYNVPGLSHPEMAEIIGRLLPPAPH